jgi:hypothetical protein
MLNNPPELTIGRLPSASPQTPSALQYPFIGDTDYLGSERHRWLIPFDIGVITYQGSNSMQITQGLANGASMTVNVDQTPDRWIVAVWGEEAAGAAIPYGVRIARVSLGPGSGGPGYQLGAGGKLKVPAQGFNYLTVSNISTVAITLHGTIIAIGGFDLADIDLG